MSLVTFIHRSSRPEGTTEKGAFYWVENGGSNNIEVLFSPSTSSDDLILLNDEKVIDLLKSDVDENTVKIEAIQANLKWKTI